MSSASISQILEPSPQGLTSSIHNFIPIPTIGQIMNTALLIPPRIFRPSYGPALPYYILGHHFVTILWESSHGEKSAKQLAKEIATH